MRDEERIRPPRSGSELDTLRGFLDWQRDTLEWKCDGVSRAGLGRRLPPPITTAPAREPSAMTLAGLVKHLTNIEYGWFERVMAGRTGPYPWPAPEGPDGPDWEWEWTSAPGDDPDELWRVWRQQRSRSDAVVEAAAHGVETLSARRVSADDEPVSLRWVLVHMIEEYARHLGHADLLRENVDGATGE